MGMWGTARAGSEQRGIIQLGLWEVAYSEASCVDQINPELHPPLPPPSLAMAEQVYTSR